LAAALKLSAVVAGYIGKTVKVSDQWLPVISFIVVFIIVIILVHLGAKAIEKSVQAVMLGWVNRIGGIIFYLLLYFTIFSVLPFLCRAGKVDKTGNIKRICNLQICSCLGDPKPSMHLGKLFQFSGICFHSWKNFLARCQTIFQSLKFYFIPVLPLVFIYKKQSLIIPLIQLIIAANKLF
jgi:hypothetical protein